MVSYTPSEDARYAFAVGRVRAREARMLTRSQLERLADVHAENQLISSLADTPYGETGTEDADSMLERAAVTEDVFFKRYLEEESVRRYFAAFDMANNLKWALRRRFGAEMNETYFVKDASSPEEFGRMLEGENTGLPGWVCKKAAEVVAVNYEKLDPASIDIMVDKALVEYQHQVSRGYSFLSEFLSLRVDYANLGALLRLKAAGESWEEFERVFLPYGTVSIDRFKGWWDAGQEAWAAQITTVDRFARLADGLREAAHSFLLMERQAKELEIEFLLTARRLTFGYEPLVGYAMLKREERNNIRKVITGLRYNLDPQITRKSIAWFD